MDNEVFAEVLAGISWDRKFANPMSNRANTFLEDEIQRKQNDLFNVENKVSQHKERISGMTDHLNNVQPDCIHTQALCMTVEKQKQSQLHFKVLADREMGWLYQEVSQQQHEHISLQQNKNSKENFIFKATQKTEERKRQLNCDQQTLDARLEELACKDEDTMVILKYAQQDESRIRELTLNMEKLSLGSKQKRKALDSEFTETITAQVALEKTVEMVQQAQVGSQELISQWENAIKQMRKKDQDLQQHALLLALANQINYERRARLKEKQNFLANEAENKKDCKRKLATEERQVRRLQQQFQETESSCACLQDELVSLKGREDHTATDLEVKRSHLASIKKAINNTTAKLEEKQQNNVALEVKLHAVTEEVISVEERAAQMEQLHLTHETHLKEIYTQHQQKHKLLFQKKQELQTVQAKETDVVANIVGSRVALSSHNRGLSKLDQKALKLQDYINNQDFQIQFLEGKCARLSGNVNKEEKQILEKHVVELKAVLEEKKKAAALLSAQHKKLENDIRCVRKKNEKTGAENRDLTTKIDEMNLVDDTLNKDLKRIHLNKMDSVVENNILQLEVKRLRNLLNNKADGVLSLEKKKLQLQTTMKEQQEEICVHQELLIKQLKITEQKLQGVRAQLYEGLSIVEKMKKKYEIVTISMAAPEGEEDKSQAYYIIKAAQNKEELQRKGDDLDAKICKAEKETEAMENTMHLLNSHNNTCSKSFNKVTETTPDFQEKLKLEEHKRAVEERLKFIRCHIGELQDNIELLSSSLDIWQLDEAAQQKRNTDLKVQNTSLKNVLMSQQERLDRVIKQSSKLTKEIRSSKNTTEKTFEEHDLQLKALKDSKKLANKLLLEGIEQHPDVQEVLQMYFVQVGIPLPSPSSALSSRCSKPGTARSSASLRSSGPSAGNSARGLGGQSPAVNTVELGLVLFSSDIVSGQWQQQEQ